MAAQHVCSDVQRTVDEAEEDVTGKARPLSDNETDAKVLAGRLPGVGIGLPGPVLRMSEANAAGTVPKCCIHTCTHWSGLTIWCTCRACSCCKIARIAPGNRPAHTA